MLDEPGGEGIFHPDADHCRLFGRGSGFGPAGVMIDLLNGGLMVDALPWFTNSLGQVVLFL